MGLFVKDYCTHLGTSWVIIRAADHVFYEPRPYIAIQDILPEQAGPGARRRHDLSGFVFSLAIKHVIDRYQEAIQRRVSNRYCIVHLKAVRAARPCLLQHVDPIAPASPYPVRHDIANRLHAVYAARGSGFLQREGGELRAEELLERHLACSDPSTLIWNPDSCTFPAITPLT